MHGAVEDTPIGYRGFSEEEDAMSSYTTVYKIDGVYSGHCRAVVSKALGELEGVVAVQFDLSAGRATVTTTAEPDDALIAEKADDAGYDFIGRA